MAKIGYTREPLGEKTSEIYKKEFESAGCDRFLLDNIPSSLGMQNKKLSDLVESLEYGDTLVVFKIMDLGKFQQQVLNYLEELRLKGIAFQSINEEIDTNTSSGDMVFRIIAAMAMIERENISKRTKKGLIAAKRRGVQLGRPSALSADQVRHAKSLRDSGMTVAAIARSMRVAYTTLRRALL